ncbi:uncharacterized protein [Palaemon carinicauda]|uniref:uncharacterized protein n=1 Tax=Palaemon carinicauda TaxID=392227 RepID=UPI0035B637C2
MKIFLILTLSLCAVQCSDVLVKVIQEAYIGSCRFGCNHCQPFDDDIDNNNNNSTTTTSDPLGYYQQKLEVALQEKKALEEEVEKATTAESSINNAGNTTQDLVDAATGNTTRRHRRKRASETVTLTSCADPSSTINGTVTQVILLVLQGIQSSLAAISTDNLDTTTLDCYISLALSLKTNLDGGTLAKPSDVTQITTVAVSIQTSVRSVRVVVVVYRTEKSKELVIKIQEVEEAKEEVINAGGTVTDGM